MKKNKIIIIGSKPNANIPKDGTLYICANTAGYYYRDKINGPIISIVSASEIVSSQRKSISKQAWLDQKLENFRKINDLKVVLLTPEYFPQAISNLKENKPQSIHELHSLNDIISDIKKITDLKFPIYSRKLLKEPKYFLKYCKELLNFQLRKNYLIHPLFRPSTGIISLIWAIKTHPEQEYHICGIGFKNRGKYPDGRNNTWTPQNKIDSNHVLADLEILKVLSKRVKLYIDDEELKNKVFN
jgi:hypothetical protein